LRRGAEVVVFDRSKPAAPIQDLFQSESVTFKQGSILDREILSGAFKDINEVYHLGGMLGTSELDDEARAAIDVNITGAVNVFEAAIQARVNAVFYPTKPNVWLNVYSITKFAAEQFAYLYNQNGRTRICSLRYFNAYGPSQSLYPIRKIIPAFAARALRGLPIEVFGDGEQIVDLIYSEDLARLTIELLRSGHSGQALDCGRGIGLTVNAVARQVNAYFGNRAGIVHLPMRRGEDPHTTLIANIAPLEAVVGRLTFANWETSLHETLQWYSQRDSREIDRALGIQPLLATA
jgi:UDP-glucose 4-epimerase